jgi:alcohol dehydrogenase class IV
MTAPTLADRHRERARHIMGGPTFGTIEQAIALALAAVERETIERCAKAVDEVARKFKAAHDPMSENAADECYAAIRALADRKEG